MIAGALEVQMFANLARLQSDMTQAKGMVGTAMSSVEQAVNAAKAAFAALGIGLGVRELVDYTNRWTDLNSKLVNATGSQELANQAMAALSETARRTYSSLEATANSYLRNEQTLTELGYTMQQQIDLNDVLNNSLVISGTKGQQAESVMQALSRALANGKLSGDNFNTMIQNGGRLVEALADGLGVGTIELRKMAETGQLQTGVMMNALLSQMERVSAEAEAMPATIGDGMLQLKNAVFEMIGRFDQSAGASRNAAENVLRFADAIRALNTGPGSTFRDILEAIATVIASRFIVQIGLAVASLGTMTTAAAAATTTMGFLVASSGPIALAITGFALLANHLSDNTDRINEMKEAYNGFGTEAEQVNEYVNDLLDGTVRTTNATQSATAAFGGTRSAIEQMAWEMLQAKNKTVEASAAVEEMTVKAMGFVGPVEHMTVKAMGFVGPMEQMTVKAMGFVGPMQQIEETTTAAAGSVDEMTESLVRQIDPMETYRNMVQGIQQDWSTLIYDVLRDGKLNFKDFFDSVLDGFLRMIAQMAAADLADAVFGGGGLGSLTNGTLVNGIGNAVGLLTGGGAGVPGSSTFVGPLQAGTAAGGTGLMASIGGGIASTASSIWGGLTGAAGSIGGGIAGAGSAVMSALSAIPGWGWALGALGLAGAALDSGGTYSHNAGFMLRPVGGDQSRFFDVPAFDSGFDPVGFNRRTSVQEATAVIDTFRTYDSALTRLARGAGLAVNYANAPFGGYDEKGFGNGLFFGSAEEDDGRSGTALNIQLNKYVADWVRALGYQIDPSISSAVLSAGDADSMVAMLAQHLGVDGSHAGGLNFVPFDNYRANLHRGERVQTAAEARNSDQSVMELRDLKRLFSETLSEMQDMKRYIRELYLVNDKWDGDGLPAERV